MVSSWYFTAPWEPVSIRRGDALGFRSGADYFAELLAPGLSNGTSDARWISILSWCLKWSHEAWWNAGVGDLSQRDHRQARYAWLRPLELLWVARTLQAEEGAGQAQGRQLRGRRSVERWLKTDAQSPNFAMSLEQFRRYRQIGMYGAYRVVFRTVPGLTTGDGWTPADTAIKLARLVNESLPAQARLRQENFEKGTKWGHWCGGGEVRYWVERGWQSWATPGGLLPTPDDAMAKPLPVAERRLLELSLFDASSVRRVTAEVLASAKEARSHLELCRKLAGSDALSRKLGSGALAPLPAFSHFADTAMHTMRTLWGAINSDEVTQAPTVAQLEKLEGLQGTLEQLRVAGAEWLNAAHGRDVFPHDQVVTRLAEAMRDAKSRTDQLRALARHHNQHGGGRRWFREQADRLVPLVADTGVAASDYRFRLMPLSYLAAQCGVADMDKVLKAAARSELDGMARHAVAEEEVDAW